ncbi:hypothetical protein AVEN_182732-1 [Araneus ventricosus]|uniref:Uncharacterized protein n=1 Tax=Araneus ventricosus TaxID=182803 RepID=A0A4Y2W9R8_ARAVE|nr:hypothetical protein AVEN_182732-1 [Araneus ventricosus]
MQGLGKLQDHEIDVIPNNMEKYISFSIRRRKENHVTLHFVDSFQFLNTSLQKPVENLDHRKFSIMQRCISSPHRDLLLKKGIYPYEYMSSFSKFEETQLPPRSTFHTHTAHPTPKDFPLYVLHGRLRYPKEVAVAPKHAQRTVTGNRMSAEIDTFYGATMSFTGGSAHL